MGVLNNFANIYSLLTTKTTKFRMFLSSQNDDRWLFRCKSSLTPTSYDIDLLIFVTLGYYALCRISNIHEIRMCGFFVSTFFDSAYYFWDSSVFLHLFFLWTFLLVSSSLIYACTTICLSIQYIFFGYNWCMLSIF